MDDLEDSDKDVFGRSFLRFIGSLFHWKDHPIKTSKFCVNENQISRVYNRTKHLTFFHYFTENKHLKGHHIQ